MLKDEVWETISHKRGILCIGHTEELLGRRIAIDDLLDCPGNSFTFLLWDREFPG